MATHIWLRAETKPHERRTHLTPERVKELVDHGFKVTVEKSKQRIFQDQEYASISGVEMVPEGEWINAPKGAVICGVKELPQSSEPIKNQHIYFAHAFKNQFGWAELLHRFVEGSGSVLDVEFMTDDKGIRVVAEFAPMAGFTGMAVGLLAWCAQHLKPDSQMASLEPFNSERELIDQIKDQLLEVNKLKGVSEKFPRVIVIGALGRCGRGAIEMAEKIGVPGENIAKWDLEETKQGGPFPQILDFDIFVNCIFLSQRIQPFVTLEMLNTDKRALTVVVDVSCDCTNPDNPIPIYDDITTFKTPTRQVTLSNCSKRLDVVAIDHLPSLLPRESSIKFANKITPYLMALDQGLTHPVWTKAHQVFKEKAAEAEKVLKKSEN